MKNKTVEVGGMVYEIGKYYLFNDSLGSSEVYDKLTRVHQGEEYGFVSGSGTSWRRCSAVAGELGTITLAPVKLIDGEAYSFDYCNGSIGMIGAVMRYRKSSDYFYFDNTFFERKYCKNITRLVPEVK